MTRLRPTSSLLWLLAIFLASTVPATAGIRVVENPRPTAKSDEAETASTTTIAYDEEDWQLPDLSPAIDAPTVSAPALEAFDRLTSHASVVIVEPGDNLPLLARRHDATVGAILALNPGFRADSRLIPGDALRVPDAPDRLPTLPDLSRDLHRGLRGRKQIALTFDACWVTEKDLDRLLDALTTHGAKATFFLTGIFLDEHPKAAERIAARGFPVHNHTRSHPHCLKLSNDEIASQLLSVERAIAETAGRSTRPFWRPPYGERDERVLGVAAQAGFRAVSWTIDSLDWTTNPPRTPEMLFERVCKRPFEKARGDPDPLDGAIVLFHVGGKSTPDAVDRIVPYLREKGYRFVTVAELIEP